MELEMNVFEAGTGAVRSTEATDERWDLMTGFGIRRVRRVANFADYDTHPIALLHQADDLIGQWLGGQREDDELENAAFKIMVAASLIDHPTCKAELTARFDALGFKGQAHLPYWGMVRLSTTHHEGAVKYGEENWHHGFTVKSLCNRTLRHLKKWVAGDNTEDHLGHAMWNVVAAIHMFHKHPEMAKLLLGENWSITPELQDYHDRHASRRKMSAAEKSRQDMDAALSGPADLTAAPDPFRNLPNDGSLRSVGQQ